MLENEYRYLVHPGEILLETLEGFHMTQTELSLRIDVAKETINDIIRGRDNLSTDMALKLSMVFGTSMGFWVNLQSSYTVAKTMAAEKEKAEAEAGQFAIKEVYGALAGHRYVSSASEDSTKIQNLWRFFGVSELANIPKVQEVAFLRKPSSTGSGLALAAWLRCGELDARMVEAAPFDKEELTKAIEALRPLMARRGDFKVADAAAPLAKAGVVLVKTFAFKGLGVLASARWLSPTRALIQLTERETYADQAWFSLFHELGHLLKHGKKEKFVEFAAAGDRTKEAEADAFANDLLIPRAAWRQLGGRPYHHTTAELQAFAKKIGVAPGLVAGRYERESGGRYPAVTKLRRKVRIV
jgi:HTH-type transcriptional regulator/antitoxin HigA